MKILILLLVSFNLLAQQPYRLNMGDSAPFQGVLLTEPDFIEASNAKRNLRLSDLRVENMTELLEAQDKVISAHAKRLNKSQLDLEKSKSAEKQNLIVGFVVGVLTTTLIAYSLKATR